MKIAVIGTGISGLVASYLLAPVHELTVFEANDYVGGHTNTVNVEHAGQSYAIDTGFIVFNDRTYPNFLRLLARLRVPFQKSDMSFSVRCERTGLEYAGSSLDGLFAQRSNLLRPSFHRMVRDILRFNREAQELLADGGMNLTLGEFLDRRGYGQAFVHQYLFPMAAAIWSAPPGEIQEFPAAHFVRFFSHHGLLSLRDRPQWYTVRGGARQYVQELTRSFRSRIRTSSPVRSVRRTDEGVWLKQRGAPDEHFDRVVLATHADQALRLLSDATPAEREILSAFRFQRNEAVLHTDVSLLPRRRRAWASWNYHIPAHNQPRVAVTYDMNRLQSLTAEERYCVTLNHAERIDPARILGRYCYDHPVYDRAAFAAQARHAEISGKNHTYFCGAYWGYGFHEDGVNAGLTVARQLGREWESCTVACTKDEFATTASAR